MGLLTIFIHSFKDGMHILHTSKTCSNSTDVAENIYIHIKLKHMYVDLRMQTTSELIRSFFTSKLNLDILGDYTLARDDWN